MDLLHVASLTVMSFLCVFSYEVTVKSTDLMPCEKDKHVCVTKSGDCVRPPPPSVLKALNMSCYFEASPKSMTCEWSEASAGYAAAGVSLVFRCSRPVIHCKALFNRLETLMITARTHSSSGEIWSRPHHVRLDEAEKPAPPDLGVVRSSQDALVVRWSSSSGGSCRLRYRAHSSQTWSQVSDLVSPPQNPTIYSIKGLQPFTVYTAAVACSQTFGVWSRWSAGVSGRTLDRAPSTSPQLCYRLETTDSGGLLHLMWKALNPRDAGGRILGYQVSYRRVMERQLQDRWVVNVTADESALKVEEGNWSVSVAAFNTAGFGPSASLSVDTRRRKSLPPVSNLWVSSSVPAANGLWVQWKVPTAPPVTHVWWRVATNTSTGSWCTVNGSTGSMLIQDVHPTEPNLISLVTVYQQRCGPPQSLPASLQRGALMEPTGLEVTGVNKTAVTVTWEWQTKSRSVGVNRYTMTLGRDSERQTQALWPDQWQHTFLNLTPNTEYCLTLLADNVSSHIIWVRTDFDKFPVVATATPLLLLAVSALIISILSRTMYKGFFYPRVSSPQDSTAGQWLMAPKHKNYMERNILNIQDFQEMDVLGVKSAIVIGPRCSEPHDDSLLPLDHLDINLWDLRLDAVYEPGSPRTTKHHLQPLLPDEDDAPPLHHTPQTQETRQLDCQARVPGLVADADSPCTDKIMCEQEYVANSCYLGKAEQTVDSVICDTDYLPNSSFGVGRDAAKLL